MVDALDAVRIGWSASIAETSDRRTAARRLVAELVPDAVVVAGPCPRCGGPHGRPRVEGAAAEASLSYADGRAVVAVVPRDVAASIGIDAEAGHPDDLAHVERMRPGTTLREWTRVEAALKADGRGLAVDPALVRIEGTGETWLAFLPDRRAPFRGRDADGPAGIVVSVAVAPAAGAARPPSS